MTDARENRLAQLLETGKIDKKRSGLVRLAMVEEAISWPTGTSQEAKSYQPVWTKGDNRILLGKPGKEAAPDYDRCKYKDGHIGNNPNDMLPCLEQKGAIVGTPASFRDVFEELQKIGREDEMTLELLGSLLFRSAYVLDHKEVASGIWRYEPPQEVVDEISKTVPSAYGMPLEAFLHYLDALAWNEDVKYHTLGYNVKTDTGRRNNLLTCVNIVAVFLGRVSIAKFAGSFARPPVGISAATEKDARYAFPLLGESTRP
ncbi:MAG: hypothetical protein AAB554_01450 [Patescibacteria group bacterium]